VSIPIIGNPLGYFDDPIEHTLGVMAELGYDQLEICHCQIPEFPTSALRQQLSEFIESLGMKLVGSNVPDSPYFQMLTSSDDVKVALAGLQRDIDIGVDLGVEYLITFEGRVPPGTTQSVLFGRLLDDTVGLLKRGCEYAAERNIEVFIEVHPFTLGVNVEFLAKLYDGIAMDNFGICYDPCHFAVGDPDGYVDAIRTLDHRIKIVHFCDGDTKSSELHFPPGRGCLDMEGMVQALRDIKFSGRWMLDLFKYPLPSWGAREALPAFRELLATF